MNRRALELLTKITYRQSLLSHCELYCRIVHIRSFCFFGDVILIVG